MRIFEGNAQPHQPFWRFRDAAGSESGEPELEFYGVISEFSWLGDEITPKMFKDDLYTHGKGGPITVRMNSGGGDVIAASVIRSIIVDYPGTVTMRIDGLAASAATFVAMAGDRVKMQDTAFFMIHDPSVMAWGTVDELKAAIDLLKTVKAGIVDAYQGKTKMPAEKIAKMMSDETWLTARDALEMGFIDEIISAPGAKKAPKNLAIMNYVNVPVELLEPEPEPVQSITPEVERLRDEVRLLM
jgi:ATP-dependent Clp protease protease subunit